MTDAAVAELASRIGVRSACQAVGTAQAGYYGGTGSVPRRRARRPWRTVTGPSPTP